MGPLEAILSALDFYNVHDTDEEFSFNVDPDTGDIVVAMFNEDGTKIKSKHLVRLSTVEVQRVGV